MKKMIVLLLVLCCSVVLSNVSIASEKVLKISTTTSLQSSGLLDVILPEFTRWTGIKIEVSIKGTGAALRDGKDGKADLIFVHDPQREKSFVADGFGTQIYTVMYNDFVIVGPVNDPAGIKGMTDAAQALKKIAEAKMTFASRGDNSGTHTKEEYLWEKTGLALTTTKQTIIRKGKMKKLKYLTPVNSDTWYRPIGEGMAETFAFAEEKQVYTIVDRATYNVSRFGRTPPVDLDILCEGDESLYNPYSVIPVNPEKHPNVHADLAVEFVTWITSDKGQKVIEDFNVLGRPLFFPGSKDNAPKG